MFVGNEYVDVSGGAGSLNLYSIEKDELKVLVPQVDENIGGAYWMEKGVIFFTANKKNEKGVWHNPTCYEFDCKTMERREVGFFDHTIGGGISNEKDNLLNPIKERIKGETYSRDNIKATDIRIAQLRNDAGIIGAAVLGR